jgi:hypothetical protein
MEIAASADGFFFRILTVDRWKGEQRIFLDAKSRSNQGTAFCVTVMGSTRSPFPGEEIYAKVISVGSFFQGRQT